MGEPDHGLKPQAPYEPDWWCLIHGQSGHGPGCPDCANANTTSEGATP